MFPNLTSQIIIGFIVVICCIENQVSTLPAQMRGDHTRRSTRSTSCVTPDHNLGRCVLLSRCGVLYRIIKTSPRIDRDPLLFLQRSTCGFYKNEPRVCCPLRNQQQSGGRHLVSEMIETTGNRADEIPGSAQGGIHDTIESLDVIADIWDTVRNHQNLRLLPTARTCGFTRYTKRIIGGTEAGLGTYPWMVRLGFSVNGSTQAVQYGCGGTLINRNYVLTAAHCVTKQESSVYMSTIRVGEYDERNVTDCNEDGQCAPPVQDFDLGEITFHPDYDIESKSENDIALIRLSRPVRFGDFVAPICLPQRSETFFASPNTTRLVVAGWGYTNSATRRTSTVILEVDIPIITMEECGRAYRNDSALRGEIGPGQWRRGWQRFMPRRQRWSDNG